MENNVVIDKLKKISSRVGYDKAVEADALLREIEEHPNFNLWFVNNAERVKNVIGYDSYLDSASDADLEFLQKFNAELKKGRLIHTNKKKFDVYGNEEKKLDDFLTAFGVQTDDDEYTDDIRSAFTNENDDMYWGNKDYRDKKLAAFELGYKGDVRAMENDIRRLSHEYQRRNQFEGYDVDNSVNIVPNELSTDAFKKTWLGSAVRGYFTPRAKEADLEGRKATWQDYAGDAVESATALIPTIGAYKIVGSIAKKTAPKIVKKVAQKKVTPIVGKVGDIVVNSSVQPVLTSAADAGLFYNSKTLGTKESDYNPRSEINVADVGAQIGAQTASKLSILGAIAGLDVLERKGILKNSAEKAKQFIERVTMSSDDKVDDVRRKLGWKAKQAAKRENVKLDGDKDIPVGSDKKVTTKDLFDYENFLNLEKEVQRLNKSQKERQKIKSGKSSFDKYKKINEANAEDLIITPEGHLIRASLVKDGKVYFPDAEYAVDLPNGSKPLRFEYDNPLDGVTNNTEDYVSRNPAVYEQIQKDQVMSDLYDKKTSLGKGLLDYGVEFALHNSIKKLSDQSHIIENFTNINEKRERALWNKKIKKMRPFTTDTNIPVEDRKKYAIAAMNIMSYGKDVVDIDDYQKNQKYYDDLINVLGVE